MPPGHGPASPIQTSGSTGRPIEVTTTALCQLFLLACSMRGHLWYRRDLKAKNLDIRTVPPGPPPRPTRWAPIPRTGPSIRLDISRPIDELFEALLAHDPAYLQTHPNVLRGLVERSLGLGRRPAALREARTFGEALEPELRGLVRRAWEVPVVDSYSAMELGTIALQCPESENLHVQAEFVLLEVLDAAGRPCRPGETGRVVVTALHNFATPLIRYALGDYATVAGPCACGRGLPALSRVVGRQRNLLIYPNGQRIFPEARPGGLVEVAPIVQFQLVQPSVERLVFRVVPGRPWTAAEEAALRLFLRDKFRHPFQIDIEYLAELPRQPNGKFDEFISHVAPAAAARRAVD